MSLFRPIRMPLAMAVCFGLTLSPAAQADTSSALKCERTIAKAYGVYLRARSSVIRRCQDASVHNGNPGSPTDCPTSVDDEKLAAVAQKLTARIARSCGGANKVCSAADVGSDMDEPLADIGWDIGTCPDLDGEGCTNPIADCNDIAVCLECIGDQEVARAHGIAYDQLDENQFGTGSAVNSCQRALGMATWRFLKTRAQFLGKCWDKALKGRPGFTTPPGCPTTDSRTAAKLILAEKKLTRSICKECGAGGDTNRDGNCDDPVGAFTAKQIGFEPDCPDVIVPDSGRSCDRPEVSSLAEVIECVACVTEFVSECGGASAVPGATGYPAECAALP